MTAEVAIANKTGIAIAADSAITIKSQRVWKSSNKIFPLSPHNDIAIMISGAGEFNGFPWETIISEFCRSCTSKEIDKVSDCYASFRSFLAQEAWSYPDDEATSLLYVCVKVLETLKSRIKYNGVREFRTTLVDSAEEMTATLQESEIVLVTKKKSEFVNALSGQIGSFAVEIFEQRITKKLIRVLATTCFEAFIRSGFQSGLETGIVFCGFGRLEHYPVILETFVDGRFGSDVKIWQDDCHNVNDHPASSAAIIPFAQRDVAQIFMEGISADNMVFLASGFHRLLALKSEAMIDAWVPASGRRVEAAIQEKADFSLIKGFFAEFLTFRDETVVQPILEVVGALPKEEMAAMAQALVEITSLRRKVDSSLESVGGPVDVAFISKADGFVWLRQKQYFDRSANPDYERRRQSREQL